MPSPSRRRTSIRIAVLVGCVALATVVGLVTSSASVKHSNVTTIVFATQGLGTEGSATKAAISAFEKAYPNIKVNELVLSSSSNNALQQLQQRFIAGSATPDVITADVTYPATFAKAGWIMSIDKLHPKTNDFFAGQVASLKYKGQLYGLPWFINAEGVYYRTDLVKSPPTTPNQLVADAKAALAKDHSLKEGFAFEGDKYEGVVTAFINFEGGFGGTLNPANLDTPQNVAALTFMRNLIYTDKISPQAVTGWQEPNVQNAFLSGQAPFALNWPYVFQLAQASGSSVKNKTGWIPFPSTTGKPEAALGGDDLVINAKSQHVQADWTFIKYLTGYQAQLARAIAAGDPPAIKSAYGSALYSKAPYFRQEETVFKYATPRPVSPVYTQISADLQTMLSSVLSNQESPASALKSTAPQVKTLYNNG